MSDSAITPVQPDLGIAQAVVPKKFVASTASVELFRRRPRSLPTVNWH
jgi:hypothetical protein